MVKKDESIEEALEPDIDIDLSIQRKVLELELQLGERDHYQLLGVSEKADKREIKSAYFALMNILHTDKFYGKNIGQFGPRLQRVIAALTKANDTLGRKKTRAEYDTYLLSRRGTQGARQSTTPGAHPSPSSQVSPRVAVAPIDVVHIPRAPAAPVIDNPPKPPSVELPPKAAAETPASVAPAASSNPAGAPSSRSEAARRRLARKMGGQRSVPAEPSAAQRRQAVQADLKARLDARNAMQGDRLQKHLDLAEACQSSGDWGGAINAMKAALATSADDAELKKRFDALQQRADEALAPKFLDQARYEEKDGRLDRAARSYERAARGKNSGELFNKAAECLLRLGENDAKSTRKCVELARQAVTIEQHKASYRITLAKAYDGAGMRASAVGEAQRALELDPKNEHAKELHKHLK